MSVPSPFVATSGTGAAAISADNFNTLLQGGMTLALARGFSGVQNQQIYLVGYVSANDGGSGNFIWVLGTGTDDGGVTTIVPTGNTAGYWSRLNLNGALLGTTTNNNAAAGYVGEYIPSTSSPAATTTATPTNITSISLTAGDWDVWGNVAFDPAGSTVLTGIAAGINTISATFQSGVGNGGNQNLFLSGFTNGTTQVLSAGQIRLSLATATTVYLIGEAIFTTSTMQTYGFLGARRRR